MPNPFKALGLDPKLVTALAALGYEEPTPIQQAAIPPLLAGRDLLGQAATGTGKTAAFALPLLQQLGPKPPIPSSPSVLVLVPTRELAMQVAEACHRYGQAFGALTMPVYGGQEFSQQIRLLRRGVHVVVATPGRALDHLRRATLDLSRVTAIVLDEADEMLDMGFAEDIEALLKAAPTERQTALFSATMAPRIATIAERHLRDPIRVLVAREPTPKGTLPQVRQVAFLVPRAQKVAALGRILDLEDPGLGLIFCRTRHEVDGLAESLAGHGHRALALHGGMTQEQRSRAMKRTREGSVDLLVATDVAARGLDIEQITHVVNYNVPESAGAYVHRIGRTGRAGRAGVAITLYEPREQRMLRTIEQLTKQRIEIARLPTADDIRATRLEQTRAALRTTLNAGELDGYRGIVASLALEFPPMDVAAAAVKLAHLAGAGAVESSVDADSPPIRATRVPATGAKMGRIFVGAGRKAKMRPADLVGAIVNDGRLAATDIGAIEIADRFSLVDVPEDGLDSLVAALRATTIKGKRQTVRRDVANRR